MPEPIRPHPTTPTLSIGIPVPPRLSLLSSCERIAKFWNAPPETASGTLRAARLGPVRGPPVTRPAIFSHLLRRCEGNQCVAACLAQFLESRFGAVDPFGYAIFDVIARARRGLRYDRTQGHALRSPRRPDAGGGRAQLFRKDLRVFYRCVRQDKHEGPSRVFDSHIGLADRSAKRTRQLI